MEWRKELGLRALLLACRQIQSRRGIAWEQVKAAKEAAAAIKAHDRERKRRKKLEHARSHLPEQSID